MPSDPATRAVPIQRHLQGVTSAFTDHLAVEEPLEIRVGFGPEGQRTIKPLAVTMRTPGHDFELVAGFLVAEQIIARPGDLRGLVTCGPETLPYKVHNVVRAELDPAIVMDLPRLERHFFTNSSCGICGKTTLAALATRCPTPIPDSFRVTPELLCALPEFLRTAQPIFDRTGGLHAAALFNPAGKLLALREDVGRHNALDKLVGSQFLAGALPLHQSVLLLSGRASFELLQKAIVAGIPVVASVGAPSSLAVDLAKQFNVTLVGFLRDSRFNIYAAPERIAAAAPSPAIAQK